MRVFGVFPRQMGHFTTGELDTIQRELRDMRKAAQKAARENR